MKIDIFKISLLCVVFGCACTEGIDIDLNEGENNHLVVDGEITNLPKAHSVRLTRSTSYFYNQPAPAELGATVTITDGENTFILLDDDNDGTYLTDSTVCGVPGRTYTLNIELANGETYTASDYMPLPNSFDTIYYDYTDTYLSIKLPEHHYIFYSSFTEHPGVPDCYVLYVYFNDSCYNSEFKDVTWTSDGDFDGNEMFRDIEIADANEDSIPQKAEARFDLYSISEEYYDFIGEFSSETFGNSAILQGPPANIPTNVSNGALGFFCAKSIDKPYRLKLE